MAQRDSSLTADGPGVGDWGNHLQSNATCNPQAARLKILARELNQTV